MRIKMLTAISGADFALAANDETDRFSEKEAIALIKSQQAVPVTDAAPIERAVKAPAPERRQRSRRKSG